MSLQEPLLHGEAREDISLSMNGNENALISKTTKIASNQCLWMFVTIFGLATIGLSVGVGLLRNERAILNGQISEITNKNTELQKELSFLQGAKDEIAQFRNQIEQLVADGQSKDAEIEELQSKTTNLEAENSELSDDNRQLRSQVESHRTDCPAEPKASDRYPCTGQGSGSRSKFGLQGKSFLWIILTLVWMLGITR